MKLPRLPCETTMSGKFLSGGWAQGYHTAPLSAGPSVLAGISMARIPAPCASVAVRQRMIAPGHLQAYIGEPPAQRRYQIFDLCLVLPNDALELAQQCPPRLVDLGRPFGPEKLVYGIADHAKEFSEQLARRTVGVVRLHLATDHAKAAGAVAGMIQHRIDGQRQH